MSSSKYFYLALSSEPCGANASSSPDPLKSTAKSITETNGFVESKYCMAQIQTQLDTVMKSLPPLFLEGEKEGMGR